MRLDGRLCAVHAVAACSRHAESVYLTYTVVATQGALRGSVRGAPGAGQGYVHALAAPHRARPSASYLSYAGSLVLTRRQGHDFTMLGFYMKNVLIYSAFLGTNQTFEGIGHFENSS